MLVTVGSITTAARLAKLAEKNTGAPAEVLHTPSSIKNGGCSYSVRFNDRYEGAVRRLIRDYKVPAKQFYREGIGMNGREYHAVS